jgi:two-component system, NtrC family, sensor kinase
MAAATFMSSVHSEESNDGLVNVLEAIGQGVVVVDTDKRLTACNNTARRLLGLEAGAEALPPWGTTLHVFRADQITPLPEVEFPLTLALRGQAVEETDFFVRHGRAMEGCWLGIQAQPMRLDGRAVTGGVLVCRDRTNAKKAQGERAREQARVERALRESEAFYHSLVENLPQNIFRKDCDGHFTFGNGNFCTTLKMQPADLLGKTDYDLFPARLARKYVEDDRRVMDSRQVFETVEEHHSQDGRKLYVQVVKSPILDTAGRVIGTQGMFWDVTERKQHEEALANSERRYRQLTEATQDAIVVADAVGTITLFNPAAERMFGVTAEAALGQQLLSLVPDELQEGSAGKLSRLLANRLATEAGRPAEMTGRRGDGTTFPLELALSMIDTGAGGAEGIRFLAAIRDLTERNRFREMLVQNEKLASIGLLSAGVAHEINNPLAFVANNLAVLERDNKGLMEILRLIEGVRPRLAEVAPAEAAAIDRMAEEIDLQYVRDNLARLLSRTREGVDRVTKIVHSLRGLARTDSPKRLATDLSEVINNSLEILRGRLKRNNVTATGTFDADSVVPCVQTQMGQVILNLLVNAVQAVEATNRPDGQVSIVTKRQGTEMLIEVADNGTGISPANLPKLFDPFFTTKDVGEGTGLGLSIAHNIVRGHGGRIEVDSQLGVGTRFRVFLPCNQEEKAT